MPDLLALTALGRAEPARLTIGPFVLAEDVTTGLASVAYSREAAATAPLPEPGRWIARDGFAMFWSGPGQAMVEVAGGATRDLERELAAAFPGAALVEQTDAYVIYEIACETAPDLLDRLLEKLVNIDPARLSPGGAARTGLEHMSVFVVRRSAARLGVLGTRSMAGSLWHILETAAQRL